MQAFIKAIEFYVPQQVLTNEELAAQFPDWTADKIEAKTGIVKRHIASEQQCASDLAVEAARRLFDSGVLGPDIVDYVLFCTQSPDYFLPTTACIIQDRLGIPTHAGALDFNLGCSGFVYGLGLAKGLIESGQAHNVLLLTAETYSKHLHAADRSVRTIFGDGAAATLVQGIDKKSSQQAPLVGPFAYGSDGRGASNLIVPVGGMRQRRVLNGDEPVPDEQGVVRGADNLYMNGAEIFTFTLNAVPTVVRELLARAGLDMQEIDLFVFHQANAYILDHIRKKLRIPETKFVKAIRDYGNTVSATIPIALKQAENEGQLLAGQRVMLVGFGVGYSWGAGLIRWMD